MTPREWARLQGFPDTFKLNLADTHLYKQFGNSVSVPVIEEIAKKIKEVIEPMNYVQEQSANRGEWAEIYTMFKLLADGKLYAADKNMKKLPNIFLPILSVIREEIEGSIYDYRIGDKIRIYLNDEFISDVDINVFENQAKYLFNSIKSSAGASFSIPETEKFMTSIYVNKIKQPGTKKADIMLRIQEINSGLILEPGFSIKSNFKAKAHLINASEATNFIYQIKDFDDVKMNTVNGINTNNKIQERMQYIKHNSSSIKFQSTYREITANNLMLIDSQMPEILSYALYYHYFENIKTCYDISEKLVHENPFSFSNGLMYSYKLKKFLCACALGMNLGKKWNGDEEANGGYIIVKDNGDIIAYHIYYRNVFENYLLNDTKFERGSTNKHKFGIVYKDNGNYYLKLNLAVRFI